MAAVKVGYVPRLGIAGADKDDDIVFGIIVMGRDYQTGDVLPQLDAEIAKMNSDGSLPPGVKIVPFYNRGSLVSVTTHTVIHNLIFGCILIFLIQFIFLGDLRSAIIVGLTIPFALSFAVIILVLNGESANLFSLGAVDFGIIVDSAVILIENTFRNFQKTPEERVGLLERLSDRRWGSDPTRPVEGAQENWGWTDRLRLILISALQVDKAVFFSILIIVAAFVPLFTMQGVEGAIFGPMARTYAYALTGALIATFTVTPVLASLLFAEHVKETETLIVHWIQRSYNAALVWALSHRMVMIAIGAVFLVIAAFCGTRLGSEFLPHLDEGNLWIRAELPLTTSLEDGQAATNKMRQILLEYPEVVTVVSQHGRPDDGSDASPFSNVELFVPLKPYDDWPKGMTKDKLVSQALAEFQDKIPGVAFNFSQYIQDNIEEGVSGVKGENSVKIIGRNFQTLTDLASQVQAQMIHVRALPILGCFRYWDSPISISRSTGQKRHAMDLIPAT